MGLYVHVDVYSGEVALLCVCACVLLLEKSCYCAPDSFYNKYIVWTPIENLLSIWSYLALFVPDQPSTGFLNIVEGRSWWGRSQLLAVRIVSNFELTSYHNR